MKDNDRQIQQILKDTSQHLKSSLASLAQVEDVPSPLLSMYANFINETEMSQGMHSTFCEIKDDDSDGKAKLLELLSRLQSKQKSRSSN